MAGEKKNMLKKVEIRVCDICGHQLKKSYFQVNEQKDYCWKCFMKFFPRDIEKTVILKSNKKD